MRRTDQNRRARIRRGSVVSLGGGIVGVGVFLVRPLYEVGTGVQRVQLHGAWISIAICMAVFGVAGLTFGERIHQWFPTGHENFSDIKLIQWIALVSLVTISVAVPLVLRSYLTALGYMTKS